MSTTFESRIRGISSSVALKAPARVATTADITLSGLQTVDGILLEEGDRVLVKDQTDATENGVYDASPVAWARSLDFNENRDITKGTVIVALSGDTGSYLQYRLLTDSPTIGGALTFELDPSEASAANSAATATTKATEAAASEATAHQTAAMLLPNNFAQDSKFFTDDAVGAGLDVPDAVNVSFADTTEGRAARMVSPGGNAGRRLMHKGWKVPTANSTYRVTVDYKQTVGPLENKFRIRFIEYDSDWNQTSDTTLFTPGALGVEETITADYEIGASPPAYLRALIGPETYATAGNTYDVTYFDFDKVTSEVAAATSATNAATSETNAAASAAAIQPYASLAAAAAVSHAAPVLRIGVRTTSGAVIFFRRYGSDAGFLTDAGGTYWVPEGNPSPEHSTTNTTPGTTDMTAAISRAIDWAGDMTDSGEDFGTGRAGAKVDFHSTLYAVSSTLTVDKPIVATHTSFVALAGFVGTYIMETTAGAESAVLHDLDFDGGLVDAGGGSWTRHANPLLIHTRRIHVTNIRGVHFPAYGMRVTEFQEGLLSDIEMREWKYEEAGTTDATLRTAKAYSIETDDGQFANLVGAQSLEPIYVQGSLNVFTGCHFYNGGDTGSGEVNSLRIDQTGGLSPNNQFIGCYFDNGNVLIETGSTHGVKQSFIGCNWQRTAAAGNTKGLIINSTATDETSLGLTVTGCRFNGTYAGGITAFEGSGTHVADGLKDIKWIGNVTNTGAVAWHDMLIPGLVYDQDTMTLHPTGTTSTIQGMKGITIAADYDANSGAVPESALMVQSDGADKFQVTPTSVVSYVPGIFEDGVQHKALSADPSNPASGYSVTWLSDGTGSGDAGDLMIKINVGGTTKTATLVDYSTLP